MKKYIEGIKFGMIVQLIIGPNCLLVFHTSKNNGFFFTIPLILTIALVDALYITLACLGVSKILENKKTKKILSIVGAIILMIFGLNVILNVFDISIIPGLSVSTSTKNIVVKGLIVALSNPITIMFWGSVLTTKIIQDKIKKKDLVMFCIGLVSATIIFQAFIALMSTFLARFISSSTSKVINMLIGFLILYYGLNRLYDTFSKKKKNR